MVEVTGAKQEANVEVFVRRSTLEGRDLVDVDVEQFSTVEDLDAHLFEDLPPGRGDNVDIIGIDVTTGLQPSMELAMKDQQQRVRCWREHE